MPALLIAAIALSTQEATLTEEHRQWLHDVQYIITEEERELFLSLSTREERERAIEVFWDHRDPDRLTPENEFRVEHYRRLETAARRFGGGATRAGARTDRGRYYILLGEPQSVVQFVGSNEVVPCEIWFYNGDPAKDLPPRFNLVFFKEDGIGDYQLYSPMDDGPAALLNASVWLRDDRIEAVDILQAVSLDLARASLTVDLSEAVGAFLGRNTGLTDDGRPESSVIPLDVRPSQNSNLIIANILESATRNVDTDYVEGYRRYGARVDADYSFKYVSNRDYWSVLYEPNGAPFVHFGIELDPRDVTFRRNEDGDTFETRFRVDIDVRPRTGGSVTIPTRDAYVRLTAGELEAVSALPFSYQDSFALIPGAYQVTVTLRSVAGEHFTIIERNLSVPALADQRPTLGGVALGYDVVTPSEGGSFASGTSRVVPSGNARFPRGGDVHALAQVIGDGKENLETRLRFSVSGPAGAVQQRQVSTSEIIAAERLSLVDIEAGSYSVVVDLMDANGNVVATKSAGFDVVDVAGLARPALTYRNVVDRPDPTLTALTLSDQYLSRGDLAGAERQLRQVENVDGPHADRARWKLASVLLYRGEGGEALELLAPLEDAYPDVAEVIEGLGFAYYLQKDCQMALPRLEHAMALRPPDISVLNATGDCYQQLGRPEKAREMFELSLTLEPEQEAVRARLAELDSQ